MRDSKGGAGLAYESDGIIKIPTKDLFGAIQKWREGSSD
jgi:hypothetical protein